VHVRPEAEFMNIQFHEVSGRNLEDLRLEIFVYNVYITNQFQTTFFSGEGGEKNPFVAVNSKEGKSLKTFVPITSKNSASRIQCALVHNIPPRPVSHWHS
jgi:hypothetical protein